MGTLNINSNRSKFSLWMQAVRAFSFTASVAPILFGAVYSLHKNNGVINWELLPIVLIAGVLFHAGTNLVSEYFDYKKGVDREESFGSSRILVDGLLSPKSVLFGGILAFAIGFSLGLVLVYYHGTSMLYLGLVGLLGGFFYTGFPIGYKYFALGDLGVYLLFGPLMVIGAHFSLTGIIDYSLFIYSIPFGLLTISILNANNIRDILHDKQAKISTMATVLGTRASVYEYYFLVFGSFLSVILMVVLWLLSPWVLIVLVGLKPAIDNVKFISLAEEDKPELIMMGDVRSAQFHMMFGLLFSVGLLISKFI